ncbi:GNAT family N-acetyltransferase [Ensifer sp. NBAIM29]|nr:GNAT family N-acetyltransferase [Ensifer sp. NBAIM29]
MIAEAQRETFGITKGRAATLKEGAVMADRTARAIGSPDAHHIEVLEQQNRVLGYYWVSLVTSPAPMLLDIYVVASSRGRGLGDVIMRRVLAVLRERKVDCLNLVVSRDNHAARALYSRFGASLVEMSGDLLVLSLPVSSTA